MSVTFDGNNVSGSKDRPFFKLLSEADLNYTFVQHYALQEGTPIAVGERLPLLTSDVQDLDEAQYRHVKNVLPRIGIVIQYSSVYEERFDVRLEVNKELIGDQSWRDA